MHMTSSMVSSGEFLLEGSGKSTERLRPSWGWQLKRLWVLLDLCVARGVSVPNLQWKMFCGCVVVSGLGVWVLLWAATDWFWQWRVGCGVAIVEIMMISVPIYSVSFQSSIKSETSTRVWESQSRPFIFLRVGARKQEVPHWQQTKLARLTRTK